MKNLKYNNNLNLNFQQSINTVVTGNINVANQINVQNMAGKKKRRKRGTEKVMGNKDKKKAGVIARMGLQALLDLHQPLDDHVLREIKLRRNVYHQYM